MENIEFVLLALEKIAQSTGEDEDDDIFTLQREFNIKIKEEEVPSLRDVLKNECIWIWVLKLYNQKDYELEKEMNTLSEKNISMLGLLLNDEEINKMNLVGVNLLHMTN